MSTHALGKEESHIIQEISFIGTFQGNSLKINQVKVTSHNSLGLPSGYCMLWQIKASSLV